MSQVGEVAKESRGEILFFISWVTKGRTDGRNHLRRFHEVPRIIRSCRGAKVVTTQVWKGSKLRRGSTVDPSRSGPLDYSRDRLSRPREKRFFHPRFGSESHEVAKWREIWSHPSEEDRCQRSVISRTREFTG
jgi:hypothetical protein